MHVEVGKDPKENCGAIGSRPTLELSANSSEGVNGKRQAGTTWKVDSDNKCRKMHGGIRCHSVMSGRHRIECEIDWWSILLCRAKTGGWAGGCIHMCRTARM